ncbi:hypothetical protein RUND412_010183 [Rhizina undulata]
MVSSISRSIPSPSPRPPPPHYQTYLTPILHRRFARACLIALAVCYLEAYIISDKSNFFWTLFPLSWTGLKCFILFNFSAFPVLVMRIAQLHVGSRANPSAFHTFRKSVGSFSTYMVIFAYILASIVFIILYLSASTSNDLKFIIEGKSYERPRLNERYLYLAYFAVYTGCAQGVLHIIHDRGKVEIDKKAGPFKELMRQRAPFIFANAFFLSLLSGVTAPLIYLAVRPMIWTCTLNLARRVYWLNRSSAIPSFPVGPTLFFRSVWVSMLLGLLWETTHTAFSVYFTQEPLKDGKPVSEKSPDPNGTLITGLKASKAPLTQSMAFWELKFISKNLPNRRRSIFTDVDRKPVNVWEQILKECLHLLMEVDLKLEEVKKPAPSAKEPSTPQPPVDLSPSSPPPIPISQQNVLLTSPNSGGRKFIESVQSKDGTTPNLQLMKRLQIQAPTIAEAEASVSENFKAKLEPFLATGYGEFFRKTIQRTTSSILPNVQLQKDAVVALSQLICASLTEDEYGVVQNHVPAILQSFCATLNALEAYAHDPPVHWTDVYAKQMKDRLVLREPAVLIKALKASLRDIAKTFAPYLKDMVISPEVRKKLDSIKQTVLVSP